MHGQGQEMITDWIDPVLLRADPHVAFWARKARGIVKRVMREFMRGEGGKSNRRI